MFKQNIRLLKLFFIAIVISIGCSKSQSGTEEYIDLSKVKETSIDKMEITIPNEGFGRIWAADSCYLLFASSDEYKYCVYNYKSNEYWKIGIDSEMHPLVYSSYLPNNFEVNKNEVNFDVLNRQESVIASIQAEISNSENHKIDLPVILRQHSLAFVSGYAKNNSYFYKDSLIISTLESGMHTLNVLNSNTNIDRTFFSYDDRFERDEYFFSNMHSNFSSLDGQMLIIAYRLFPRFDLINLESLNRKIYYLERIDNRLPDVEDNFPSKQNITYFSRPTIKADRIYLPLYNQRIIDVGTSGPKTILIIDLNGQARKKIRIKDNIYLYPVFNENHVMFAMSADIENKLYVYELN